MTTETTTKRRGNPEALAEYRRKVAAGEIIPRTTPKPKKVARDRFGRPRDSQKSRVYKAESFLPSRDDAKLGVATETRNRRGGWGGYSYPDISVAQAYVDELTRQRWFQSRWGNVQIPVVAGNGNNADYRGRVMLSGDGRRDPSTIIHEVAHWLVSKSCYAGHGPEFAATMVTLVDGFWGVEVGRQLRAAYVACGVKYRTGMHAVPKPGTKTVVTKSARLEKERQAKERRQKELASSSRERNHAADVIRALAAEGHFGPAGAKPRTQALAVARRIAGS